MLLNSGSQWLYHLSHLSELDGQILTVLLELMLGAWRGRLAGSSWLWFPHDLHLWSDRVLQSWSELRESLRRRGADRTGHLCGRGGGGCGDQRRLCEAQRLLHSC